MIQFICFSRKRPLQLHGYITSLFANWTNGEVAVAVLVKIDEPYRQAYGEVRERFPYVHFVEETDFRRDLQALLDRSAADIISFGCDDVVFVEPISPAVIRGAFEDDAALLGISLRLGRNVTCDMFGRPMAQPSFIPVAGPGFCLWNVSDPASEVDWAYPWEVLGTLYPADFVRHMTEAFEATSPSQLEDRGLPHWASVTERRHLMAWPTSRIVVPTPNMVQREFSGNGIRGAIPLEPEFLLDCWQNGLRMDVEPFQHMTPPSWRVPEFYLRRLV